MQGVSAVVFMERCGPEAKTLLPYPEALLSGSEIGLSKPLLGMVSWLGKAAAGLEAWTVGEGGAP